LLAHGNDRVVYAMSGALRNLAIDGRNKELLGEPGFTKTDHREVRGAGLVLQSVWGYKELRRTLEKDGWKKTDFMVNLNPTVNNDRPNGGFEDSTLPLLDKGWEDVLLSFILSLYSHVKNKEHTTDFCR
ncbi:hypothetical protein GOODEAATRI_014289, partial [Goodea atripinnis]